MQWRIHLGLARGREDELLTYAQQVGNGDEFQFVSGRGAPPPLPKSSPGLFDAALALTTLQDAKRLRTDWQGALPGLYFHPKKYDVSYWLPRMSAELTVLNRGGQFLPANLVRYVQQRVPPRLFVRPNSGLKPFAGFVLDTTACQDWGDIQTAIHNEVRTLNADTMLYLADAWYVHDVEWRFWVVNRTVVASTPYSWDRDDLPWQAPPPAAFALANRIANQTWQPDIAYVVDVGSLAAAPDRFHLIELNAASTSGFYAVPFEQLFPALRAAVLAEYAGDLCVSDDEA